MSVTSMMNQTVSIANKSGRNAQGRATVGSATSVRARFQPQQKTRYFGNNQVKVIDAIAYVPAGTAVEVGDKLTYDSKDYAVDGVYETPDGSGNTNHVKLELRKWQATA